MKKITILLVLALFGLSANSQVTFQKTFGSPNVDIGNYVEQTTDGGYIIAGVATDFIAGANQDIYLVKTDSSGSMEWSKTYGGTDNEIATCVKQTPDGGYIVSGYDNSGITTRGGFLIKINSNGDTVWTKSFDGVNTRFNSILQTSDGNYIVAGSYDQSESFPFLLKISNNGNVIWGNEYYPSVGSNTGKLYSVEQTFDGDYIACGNCLISGNYSIYLLKVNDAGNVLLSKTFSYPFGNYPYSNTIQQTNDGGYILTAYYYNGAVNIGMVIKLNASADIVWSKSYSGGIINSIQEVNNIGYIAITSNNYLLKIDTLGNFILSKFYQPPSGICSLECIRITTDGGFIITGQIMDVSGNNQDVYLIKTDSNGESNCNDSPYLMSPTVLALTSFSITSTLTPSVSTGAFFAYVNSPPTIENTLCTTVGVSDVVNKNEISVYPNPVSDILNLEYQSNETEKVVIEMVNLLGQKIFSKNFLIEEGSNNIILEVKEITSGVYLLQIKSKDNIFTKKIIKE